MKAIYLYAYNIMQAYLQCAALLYILTNCK